MLIKNTKYSKQAEINFKNEKEIAKITNRKKKLLTWVLFCVDLIIWSGKREPTDRYAFGLGKRANDPTGPYQFGLGKRAMPDGRYEFGLGKRDPVEARYNFGLGKRIVPDTSNNRVLRQKTSEGDRFAFGLGKRDPVDRRFEDFIKRRFSFGIGKRSDDERFAFGLGKWSCDRQVHFIGLTVPESSSSLSLWSVTFASIASFFNPHLWQVQANRICLVTETKQKKRKREMWNVK